MKQSIHKVVREIFLKDSLAVETFKKGLLNTNAYAKQIQKQVESKLKKKIKVNTITVAINRLKNKLDSILVEQAQTKTAVEIDSINVFAPVIVSTIENTPKALLTLLNIQSDKKKKTGLLSIITTPEQIVIIYKPNIATTISRIPSKVYKEFKGVFVELTLPSNKALNSLIGYLKENKMDTSIYTTIETTLYLALPQKQLSKIIQLLD